MGEMQRSKPKLNTILLLPAPPRHTVKAVFGRQHGTELLC